MKLNKLCQALITSSILTTTTAMAHTTENKMLATNEIQWQQLGETPIEYAVIWGDREAGANGTYLKLPSGFEVGVHGHSHNYNGVTIQGVWEHKFEGEWKQLPPGSYVSQKGGELHNDRCTSKEDCILLIQQDDHSDAFFPPAK
ncbi:hypothetical protein EOPP23_19605 [Endozoicomonas sp. OPT23]|uniref:DUF4437 domain-containing protein n=1 Tax=Endozoicomonas sp. OPT23 TaxID=2072845 RepID=UPI00129B06B7|nr:DUF4437 domain-containing protein [Endozoicomonas sp. OPT23]MRI35177.1 hypothetical protein [Endozoicomonas sp. OPT23]